MNAQYNIGGTGANNAEKKIAKYMGYKAAASERLDCKSYEDWLIYLKGFLDKKQPVFTMGSGHQYIVDGYDSNDYFHFNYGWGGNDNGFYLIDGYSYMTLGMAATGNIVPDYDGENEPVNGYIYLTAEYDTHNSPWGFWINPFYDNGIQKGSEEEIMPGKIYDAELELMNTSGIPYEGDIKLVLEDKDENIKQDNVQIDKSGVNRNPFHVFMDGLAGARPRMNIKINSNFPRLISGGEFYGVLRFCVAGGASCKKNSLHLQKTSLSCLKLAIFMVSPLYVYERAQSSPFSREISGL